MKLSGRGTALEARSWCLLHWSEEGTMRRLIAAVAALVLTACATAYGPISGNFGYTHTRLAPNVFEVTFRGSAATRPEQAADFALLRSAELSLAYGYRFFVIVGSRSDISTSTYTMPGYSTTTTTGNIAGNSVMARSTTTHNPGQTVDFELPRTTNRIIASKDRPDVNGVVYDAQFIWDEIRAKYKIQRGVPAI